MSHTSAGKLVELHMGPADLGGDDLLVPIIRFIDGAEKYLDIAVQEIDNREIGQAIVRARGRNVRVRVVLEADYLRAEERRDDPWTPGGKYEINREIQNALYRTRAHVHADFNPEIFHQKFVVRDREAVLMGSTNFTWTGTHRNLNHLVIVHDKSVAMEYWREFNEISKGRFGKDSDPHPAAPKESVVDDLRVKVLFAPDHNPEMEIIKQMAKARKRIDFAIFTFSKSSGIDDEMASKIDAGIEVRGLMDAGQGRMDWSTYDILKGLGAKVELTKRHPDLGKLHHKLMVIDGEVTITGSMNYTGPATTLNDENIMVIGKMGVTGVERTAQKKFAKYALNEIDRMIEEFGEH